MHPEKQRAGVQTLLTRLETGKWPDAGASNLNFAAAALGPFFNIFANSQGMVVPVPPAFVDFKPAQYLRPFDGEAEECEFESPCHER